MMAEPVPPLPSARAELPAAIDRWVRSRALTTLVEAFGGQISDDLTLDERLAFLEVLSERWDYRGGRERNLVASPRFTPQLKELVAGAAAELGLRGEIPPLPSEKDRGAGTRRYDEVLVLGGLVRACVARPLHAAQLVREGMIEARSITALGGFRTIAGDEVGLVERVLGERVTDELHAMDAGVRHAFELSEPASDRGEDSDVVGASWRVREYATASGLSVRVVAAPSTEPGVRRANTPDTYAWFANELARLQPGERVLIVTTEIYVPFQHADALRMLALPYGVDVDATGVDPGRMHPALAQSFEAHHYLQEVRSTIRALRALHTALAVPAPSSTAVAVTDPVRPQP